MQLLEVTAETLPTQINLTQLVTTIYHNFLYLASFSQVVHSPEEVTRLLSSPEMIGLILLDAKGQLQGYLFGEKLQLSDGRLCFYLNYLYLSQAYRNRGFGGLLMRRIKRIIHERYGWAFVVLLCARGSPAETFYQRYEFIPDPVIPSPPEMQAWMCYL